VALMSEYDGGVPGGGWHLLGAGNKRLVTRDFGIIGDHDALADSPALANVRQSAGEWLSLAETCVKERRFGEALVAMVRAGARSGKVDSFSDSLRKLALPATKEGADSIAGDILENAAEDYSALLAGFLKGASPAVICRSLSIVADKSNRGFAALDL